ncbi:MAG TPA: hypothetical protein VNZ63_03740, partial [Verrucomicrobiae bacterium]|nr:hypothetical protein [Verrucomicrobiae bacterium]
MNRSNTTRNLRMRFAHALRWAPLAASLLFAVLALRMLAPSLRAANGGTGPNLMSQTQEDADRKSAGCILCHTQTDQATMHSTGTVRLGCTDCHGGNAEARVAAGIASTSPEYEQVKQQAHPQPRDRKLADRSANLERIYTEWLRESPEYVRFVNPGDLRVAPETCGRTGCHPSEVRNVSTSMMTTGGMLWGAALYNNGGYPHKDTRFGESYSRDGAPQTVRTIPQPSPEESRTRGVLAEMTPLERWEISQPGNVLRVFERGGSPKGEVGEPSRDAADAGKPDDKLSTRGFGTLLRTDPVFLGLQKTRLLDPLLSLPGTNDQPGDYRASGCTACHVVYANDRSVEHSAQFAPFGNRGYSATKDPTIPREESGHPILH